MMKITVTKAEGSPRGDGWYYLINGEKDGKQLADVGGQDWYPSEKAARKAATCFINKCYYDAKLGWVAA